MTAHFARVAQPAHLRLVSPHRRRLCTLAAGLLMPLAGNVWAQAAGSTAAAAWPIRPLKVVVPFPPGGATDLVARTLADRLQARLGQTVVVDNRPGASTTIGADAVAKAPADGYTLLVSGSSTYSVVPALKPRLPYDPRKALSLVGIVAKSPLVLVAGPGTPARTLAELLAQAKAQPGQVGYATFGPGSAPHLAGELLAHEAGVQLLAVPYRGSAAAVMAVVGGEVAFAIDTVASAAPQIQAGKLRALAVLSPQRALALPEVPTVTELKLPKAVFDGWHGVAVPAGTPPAVLARLSAEVAAVMALPEVRQKLLTAGLEPVFIDAAGFQAKVAAEVETYTALGQRTGIVLD
ncbi:tripartite tricarboxylate transporter substrate binding protein [uncultured Aquincola sp.]|uniref:Bug family tripartite tricarboxylate transporter substrate binding protein n=1 Tax=uncultured Aquincola sp. TaxID=886556 RepID=UPI0032B25307